MKKILMLGVIVFLLLVSIVFAVTLTREERSQISECRKDCSFVKKDTIKQCRTDARSCSDTCRDVYDVCRETLKAEYDTCRFGCDSVYQAGLATSPDREQRRDLGREYTFCKRTCYKGYTTQRREECKLSECRRECSNERRTCYSDANDDYRSCTNQCKADVLSNRNITCENGKYKAGDKLVQGCEECECGFDGRLHCATHQYCNFEDQTVEQAKCEAAGGRYHQLCQGNIFAMRCSNEFFCLCAGNDNYTCPSEHICLEEFRTDGIIRGNLGTWADRGGRPLGDIGICVPLPDLPLCGNGVCDSVLNGVTSGETSVNCPADCN